MRAASNGAKTHSEFWVLSSTEWKGCWVLGAVVLEELFHEKCNKVFWWREERTAQASYCSIKRFPTLRISSSADMHCLQRYITFVPTLGAFSKGLYYMVNVRLLLHQYPLLTCYRTWLFIFSKYQQQSPEQVSSVFFTSPFPFLQFGSQVFSIRDKLTDCPVWYTECFIPILANLNANLILYSWEINGLHFERILQGCFLVQGWAYTIGHFVTDSCLAGAQLYNTPHPPPSP